MRHLHSYRWNGGIFPLQSNGIKEIGKPEQPEEEVVVDVACCCCWAVSTIIIIIIADVVGDDDVVVDDWFIIIISIGINNEFLQRKQTNHTHTHWQNQFISRISKQVDSVEKTIKWKFLCLSLCFIYTTIIVRLIHFASMDSDNNNRFLDKQKHRQRRQRSICFKGILF